MPIDSQLLNKPRTLKPSWWKYENVGITNISSSNLEVAALAVSDMNTTNCSKLAEEESIDSQTFLEEKTRDGSFFPVLITFYSKLVRKFFRNLQIRHKLAKKLLVLETQGRLTSQKPHRV